MHCRFCGHQNEDDARFCTRCGSQLPTEGDRQSAREFSEASSTDPRPSWQQVAGTPASTTQSGPEMSAKNRRTRSTLRRVFRWVVISIGVLIGLIVLLSIIGLVSNDGEEEQTVALSQEPTNTPRPTITRMPTPTPLPTPAFEERWSQAEQITYDDLFRNNESHLGKTVRFRGEVIQVIEESVQEFQLRVNVTRGEYFWDDTVFLWYSGPRLLEEDLIEFVGIVNGLITYESIFGGSVTIPELEVISARIRN